MGKKQNQIIEEPRQIFRKIAGILSGLIIVFLLVSVLSLKSDIEEIKQSSDNAQQATSYILDFGSDLNEIRELLLLPTKTYNFLEEEEVSEEEEDSVIADMFAYVNKLSVERTTAENTAKVEEYFASESAATLLTENALEKAEGTYEIINGAGAVLYTLGVSEDDGSIYAKNYFGEDIEITEDIATSIDAEILNLDALIGRIDALNAARSSLSTMLYESGAAYDALTAKGMWAEAEYDDGASYDYYLVNQDQSRLATLTLSKTSPEIVTWSDLTTGDMEPIDMNAEVIAELISELDGSTYLEKKIAENTEKLESLLADPAFQSALTESEVQMSEAREDEAGIYYDLTDVDGNILSTIYIDKYTGKVMVTNGGETLELMAAVQEDSTKKKLWICLNRSQSMMI